MIKDELTTGRLELYQREEGNDSGRRVQENVQLFCYDISGTSGKARKKEVD